MEMPQGNSLCSYILNKQKCHFFYFLYKIGEQKGKHVPLGGLGTSGRRRRWGKGVGR
jgi:hypothetical protein